MTSPSTATGSLCASMIDARRRTSHGPRLRQRTPLIADSLVPFRLTTTDRNRQGGRHHRSDDQDGTVQRVSVREAGRVYFVYFFVGGSSWRRMTSGTLTRSVRARSNR